jgi:hypothetical protein
LTWSANTRIPSQAQGLLNQLVDIEYQVVNGQNRLRKLQPH